MKILIILTGLIFTFSIQPAQSAGTFHLMGKVHGFDDKQISIESSNQFWRLNRSKLTDAVGKSLVGTKSGKPFDAWISFDAVDEVTDVPHSTKKGFE